MTDMLQQTEAEFGRTARQVRPRSSLAELTLAPDRHPVAIISADDADRLEWLLPERYTRMSVTPFTFYRGSASIMAFDQGHMANSGVLTQLCGDAHMSNFGAFASPERELLFDVNDFDETSPGPFEWDVQRLAASCVLAGRDAGMGAQDQRAVTASAVAGYQEHMRAFATRSELDVWYERIPVEAFVAQAESASMHKRIRASEAKARKRDAASATAKLTEIVDGRPQFILDPPFISRIDGLTDDMVSDNWAHYLESLSPDRRALLSRFEVVDIARKVVGVGSVGTRCMIVLLIGRTHGELLILQFKEAGTSVLEPFVAPSAHTHQGERVVNGQRLMQAASDIFLGWASGPDGRNYYWRQLRDMKYSPELSTMSPKRMRLYAAICGQALARAHARGGSRSAIASYMGKGSSFVDAVTEFGLTYADQAELDYKLMIDALADGKLPTAASAPTAS